MRRATLLLLSLLGCAAPGPQPITIGVDACDHCHMPVADPRFTAELLTTTGVAYRFDDIGCMAAFLAEGKVEAGKVRAAWVADFLQPGAWIPVDSARYLRSDSLHTPMASGLVALRPDAPVDSVRRALGATVVEWTAVQADAAHERHS